MPIPKPWIVVAVAQLGDGTIAKTAKRIMAKNAASAVYRRAQEIHKQYRGDLQPRVVGVSANPERTPAEIAQPDVWIGGEPYDVDEARLTWVDADVPLKRHGSSSFTIK